MRTLKSIKKFTMKLGNITATSPAPMPAPQIGAPTVHTCNAENPNIDEINPKSEWL